MSYRIYMGFDPRERLAYEVAQYSIESRTTTHNLIKPDENVKIFPIDLLSVKSIFNRPIKREGEQLWDVISQAPMSTEFAVSRFLTPFLAKTGWALFLDCDMVSLTDIKELFKLADDRYAVMVVKHNHIPSEKEKFHDGGMIQTVYPRKNWSSLVLWNCDHPANKRLTLEDVNTWRGLDLHTFKWLEDIEIGEIPQSWNFLVDVNEGNPEDQNMLHYTNGSPSWGDKWEPKPSDHIFNKELTRMRQQAFVD